MKRIFVFCVLTVALVACHKDKVESTPHLEFTSFNSDVVASNGFLRVTLDFTDKEGDLDSIFVTRQRLNKRGPSYVDFFYGNTPEFGSQNRGELQIDFNVGQDLIFGLPGISVPGSNPPKFEPDTLQLRFYVKDKAGHTSDTAAAKTLIVIR
ncbi:MAG: hypothetical protein ACXVLT_07975 [Flavisolibacter sp.]